MSKSVSQDSASCLSVVIAPSRAVNQRERSKKGAEDAQRDASQYLRRIHVMLPCVVSVWLAALFYLKATTELVAVSNIGCVSETHFFLFVHVNIMSRSQQPG